MNWRDLTDDDLYAALGRRRPTWSPSYRRSLVWYRDLVEYAAVLDEVFP